MKAFADLADLPEDERIRLAAHTAAHGHIVGLCTDDVPAKVARYIAKLSRYPIRVIDQQPGPVAGVVTIRIGPKES